MKLYHGSYMEIQKPDLAKCSDGKDFGAGFYLTSDYTQAKNFIRNSIRKAVRLKTIPSDHKRGAVTTFGFEKDPSLKIYKFDGLNKDWLLFIAANRTPEEFGKDVGNEIEKQKKKITAQEILAKYAQYDIIIGKIADDKTNITLGTYLAGTFGKIESDEAINETLRLLLPERLKDQYCFLTEKALAALTFKEVQYYDVGD